MEMDPELHKLFQYCLLFLAAAYIPFVLRIILVWPVKGEVIKRTEYLVALFSQGTIGIILIRYIDLWWLTVILLPVIAYCSYYMVRLCIKWKQLNFWRAMLSTYVLVLVLVYVSVYYIYGETLDDMLYKLIIN